MFIVLREQLLSEGGAGWESCRLESTPAVANTVGHKVHRHIIGTVNRGDNYNILGHRLEMNIDSVL